MAAGRFRGIKRLIAVALLNGDERTLYEIAKLLGKRSGDIQKVLHQMVEEGIVIGDSPEPVRGTQFHLNPDVVSEVEELLQADQAPGTVVVNQRLLTLKAPDGSEAIEEVLMRPDATGAVAWVAQGSDDYEMLVALRPAAEPAEVARLVKPLRALGVAVHTHHVTSLLTADQMRGIGGAGQQMAASLTRTSRRED